MRKKYLCFASKSTNIYNTMVQDLKIKLARKPRENVEAFKFRLPYGVQLTYRLKHEYNRRV